VALKFCFKICVAMKFVDDDDDDDDEQSNFNNISATMLATEFYKHIQ